VIKCGWCDAWEKHGLLEYGRIYCDHTDENLVYGFNPELTLGMGKIMSHGSDICEFDWIGCAITDADNFAVLRKELAPRVTKDFLYHTAHLLSALRRTLFLELGLVKGREIINRALLDYEEIFGGEKKSALLSEAEQNFLANITN
jgi:hypothetical protein